MSRSIKNYWENEIPDEPFSMEVLDQFGAVRDITGRTVRIEMLDTDNNPIDLKGGAVEMVAPSAGRVAFWFPQDRTLFPKYGEYLLRLNFRRGGSQEFSSPFPILVKRFGGTDYVRNYR